MFGIGREFRVGVSIKSTGGTLRPSGLGLRSSSHRAKQRGSRMVLRDGICRILISLLWAEALLHGASNIWLAAN